MGTIDRAKGRQVRFRVLVAPHKSLWHIYCTLLESLINQ